MKSVILLALLGTFSLSGQTPPTGATNPAVPVSPIVLTNFTTVYTNVAVQTGSRQFSSVSIYGGTNALAGALLVAWNQYTNDLTCRMKLYWGAASGTNTNTWIVPGYVSTVCFYGGLTHGTSYWFYATALSTNGMESPASNTIVAQD